MDLLCDPVLMKHVARKIVLSGHRVRCRRRTNRAVCHTVMKERKKSRHNIPVPFGKAISPVGIMFQDILLICRKSESTDVVVKFGMSVWHMSENN